MFFPTLSKIVSECQRNINYRFTSYIRRKLIFPYVIWYSQRSNEQVCRTLKPNAVRPALQHIRLVVNIVPLSGSVLMLALLYGIECLCHTRQ